MNITYGRLCELAQKHGFEMDEKLRELLRDVEVEVHASLRGAIRRIECSHTGMCYGDEKRGSVTEYTRGFGACLDAVKRALSSATTATEPSECVVSLVSSRACERGTKGCTVYHDKAAQQQAEPTTPLEVLRVTYAPDMTPEEFAEMWPRFKEWSREKAAAPKGAEQ